MEELIMSDRKKEDYVDILGPKLVEEMKRDKKPEREGIIRKRKKQQLYQ